MAPMPFASRLRLGFAVISAGLALAAPAAHAQGGGGAGDDQYADPFGSDQAAPTATPRAPAPAPAAAAPAAAAPRRGRAGHVPDVRGRPAVRGPRRPARAPRPV